MHPGTDPRRGSVPALRRREMQPHGGDRHLRYLSPKVAYAANVSASAPASWQSRQRASYCSAAPTTTVAPE
jgi:hypothetical protein